MTLYFLTKKKDLQKRELIAEDILTNKELVRIGHQVNETWRALFFLSKSDSN